MYNLYMHLDVTDNSWSCYILTGISYSINTWSDAHLERLRLRPTARLPSTPVCLEVRSFNYRCGTINLRTVVVTVYFSVFSRLIRIISQGSPILLLVVPLTVRFFYSNSMLPMNVHSLSYRSNSWFINQFVIPTSSRSSRSHSRSVTPTTSTDQSCSGSSDSVTPTRSLSVTRRKVFAISDTDDDDLVTRKRRKRNQPVTIDNILDSVSFSSSSSSDSE